MRKAVIIGIAAVAVVGVGALAAIHMNMKKPTAAIVYTKPASSSSQPAAGSSTAGGSTGAPAASVSPLDVTVTANDTSATPETISAKAGQKVDITFNVSTNGTYHGGLDFKSTDPAIDSGSIAEGSSKQVSFVATKSFQFTPFWYESDVQKDYFVTVNVD